MSEKLYSNSIKNVKKSVKKAEKTRCFLEKMGKKRGRGSDFILTSERQNAGLSGVKRKEYFLNAQKQENE